jgi:hypothetical protein
VPGHASVKCVFGFRHRVWDEVSPDIPDFSK